MAKPVPSTAQQAAIEAVVSRKENQKDAFEAAAAAQDTEIALLLLIDSAFSDLFDYYNDDIIGNYDAERKAINGTFITTPITSTDIDDVSANPPTGRLVPTPPTRDIVRVTEFDDLAYTDLDTVFEELHILDQFDAEDKLANGVSGTTPTITGTSVTAAALTASSTTLGMLDAVGPMSFSIGDVFVVHDGGTDAAVVEVTSVTDNLGGDPPFNFTLGIIVKIAPTGTIASGVNVKAPFSGFTNPERTAKTATDSDLQPIMDELIVTLTAALTARQARIAEMITALGANDDPDAIAEIATATTAATTADTFITAYLVGTDISDTGLASLATERGTRSTFLTARLVEILAAYTGQTEDYYEERFQISNDRGNTERGTKREVTNAENVKANALAMAAGLEDSITALNDILP